MFVGDRKPHLNRVIRVVSIHKYHTPTCYYGYVHQLSKRTGAPSCGTGFSPTPKSARVPGALIQTSTKTAKDFGSTWRVTTSRLLARIPVPRIVGDQPRRYHNRNVFFVWLVVSKIFYVFHFIYCMGCYPSH